MCHSWSVRSLLSIARTGSGIATAQRFALTLTVALFAILDLWAPQSFAGGRLSINSQPANQSVPAGQNATFTVVASGRGSISYQWYKNGAAISGANSSSYTTPPTSNSDNGEQFDVVVTNRYGSRTSSMATLTVNAAMVAPSIATQPVNETLNAGQTASFSVAANGTAPLAYQWHKSGVSISGATSSSYTTPATTTADSGSTFTVVVSNAAGSVTSNTATLTINAAPAPAIQLSSTSITFSNVVVGSPVSQTLIITNAGTATLSISQINVAGAGFSVSGFSLPLSVSAGQRATVAIEFNPTSAGGVSGNISIVSNAPTSPTSVSLSASAVAATPTLGISPISLSFGNVTIGTASTAQTVTVTNTGNSSLTISSIIPSAGYSLSGGGAPVTLAPSQELTLSVTFDPTAAGSANGTISIASNATGSPAVISLSGTGVAHSVALAWNASTSAVSGYNVYRSTVSGSAYVKLNSALVGGLTYDDGTVQSATTYYYVVTAVDSSGNESVYSNQASETIP